MKLYPNINWHFLIWIFAIILISYFAFTSLPHSPKFNGTFWESFANWDGGHFLGIAREGYSEKFQYAFFPLYPILINLLNKLLNNYLLSAFLISATSTFLGLQFLYKFVSFDFGKTIAQKTVLALLIFPTSFFLITVYSEGLFLLLAILTFYFLKTNKLLWATIFASLVSATRLVGLAVAAGLLIEVITTQGINRKNWFVIFAPTGFVIYSIFLFQQTGDPFYFITAENHWQRALAAPGLGFWESIRNISSGQINNNAVIDLLFAVFGVGLVIRAFRFLPISLSVYSLLSVMLPLFTPTLSSFPRFLIVIFPVFILIALVKNQYLQLVYQIISLLFLGVFTALFITGYWVS